MDFSDPSTTHWFSSSRALFLVLSTASSFWHIQGFTSTGPSLIVPLKQRQRRESSCPLYASALRKNVVLPLLDVIDDDAASVGADGDMERILTPLPSSSLPDQLTTPFVYGMQMELPLHKLIMEEATTVAMTPIVTDDESESNASAFRRPMYGHLVWKDKNSGSLVGAIGCTAEILVNAPTSEVFHRQLAQELGSASATSTPTPTSMFDDLTRSSMPVDAVEFALPSIPLETAPNTFLCRGGYRFVVKEIVKTIPFPVAIVDEIEDDADVDDSTLFPSMSTTILADGDDDEDDDDGDDNDELRRLTTPQLIQRIMMGVQSIVGQRLADANAKNRLSPLEKSILEKSGLGGGITPAAIEVAAAEEMAAVWEVFQLSLIDDIEPLDRRFAIAVMAAELADVNNKVRQELILSRNSEERLRIVLRELKEAEGMAKARKIANQITDGVDELNKDLKVGQPQLPKWALQITKGTKLEYFWNEDYGWCSGIVTEDPVTIVDEILLTIRFEDGETHKLPLTAEDKIRWRPS
jgi:hypothetical protein